MVIRVPDYRKNPHMRARMRADENQTPFSATLTTAGDYYTLDTHIVDGNCVGFTLGVSGDLTFDGASGSCFQFTGSANIKTDKVCVVNFAMFINGVLQTDAETPITFDHANSIQQISIATGKVLQYGDVITVRAKSDTATTSLTVNYFSVILWGE